MSSYILRIPKHLYCSFFKYRLYYTQCRHTYGVFLNICTIPFSNIVFTIRNVVIHMAYSKIAYLCSVSSLLYLLPISRCDWSSLPAVSSSGQSVTCSQVQHFGNITSNVNVKRITCPVIDLFCTVILSPLSCVILDMS